MQRWLFSPPKKRVILGGTKGRDSPYFRIKQSTINNKKAQHWCCPYIYNVLHRDCPYVSNAQHRDKSFQFLLQKVAWSAKICIMYMPRCSNWAIQVQFLALPMR